MWPTISVVSQPKMLIGTAKQPLKTEQNRYKTFKKSEQPKQKSEQTMIIFKTKRRPIYILMSILI